MARTKKCEIWVHFPQSNKVEKRYMETCRNEEHAKTVISVMQNHNKYDEASGYKPIGQTYSIEPYGTVKALGQIVYR